MGCVTHAPEPLTTGSQACTPKMEVRKAIRDPRVAALPDHLPLRNCGALDDRRAVVREVPVQRMGPITMSDDDVIIESGCRHLTINVGRLDVHDDACAYRDEGRPDRHIEIVGVALAAAMSVTGRRTVRLRDAKGRAHGVGQDVADVCQSAILVSSAKQDASWGR